jgi:hypothetical protein
MADSSRVEIYKLLVEMADRVSERRQTANSFYLSINTAIIGASAYFTALYSSKAGVLIIAVAGLCVSALWIRNIQSYKELNEGKFHVITELEKLLPVAAFTDEWAYLHRDGRGKKYRPFHTVEILVPWVFIVINAGQLFLLIDWCACFFPSLQQLGS